MTTAETPIARILDLASPRPWTYRRHDGGGGALGAYDWIEDANGQTILEGVGYLDGPLICAAVNYLDTLHDGADEAIVARELKRAAAQV
ncbi:MAG: hypothetical protein RL291_689 [Pseudomonadota bacterium]